MRRQALATGLVGLVLMVAGCGGVEAPTGDALYVDAKPRYERFAETVHVALMAAHEGVWQVSEKEHGAAPFSCDDFKGYEFSSGFSADVSVSEAAGSLDAADEALQGVGLETRRQSFGSGEDREDQLLASGEGMELLVVSVIPTTGSVTVTASSECTRGDFYALGEMVFDGSADVARWQRLPATEGPEWVPQFYFPPDGPVYYNEDGTPVDPQPVVTDLPVAPYGD